MKRIFFILFLIGSMALPALSQTGLHIAQLFDGPFKRRTGATEVYMKGRSVKNYGLSIFSSLSVSYSPDDLRRMETLVRLDARQAVSKEESYKGTSLYYGFYQLPQYKGLNRYIFYKHTRTKQQPATLIYMEGKASIKEIKRRFMKQ